MKDSQLVQITVNSKQLKKFVNYHVQYSIQKFICSLQAMKQLKL